MLILQRKEGQAFMIGDNICITVQEIGAGRVRFSVDAPRNVPVLRKELLEVKQENQAAAHEQDMPIHLLALLTGQESPNQQVEHTLAAHTVCPHSMSDEQSTLKKQDK